MNNFLFVLFILNFINNATSIFTDYCTSGLCKHVGGDGKHTGCRDGIPQNHKFQPSCPDDAKMIELTKDIKKIILDNHNKQRNLVAGGGLRSLVGIRSACRMGAAIWDEELAATAELHSRECTFAHDKCRNTLKYPMSGQNIGIATFSRQKALNVTHYTLNFTNEWYNEYEYTKQEQIDNYPGKVKPMIGHFLTLMNERNNRVGCTAVNYGKDERRQSFMLTCNYPVTNIKRSTIFNTCKIPGSQCTSGRDTKYSNLCPINEVYDLTVPLQHIPYDGKDADEKDNIDYGTAAEKELDVIKETIVDMLTNIDKVKPDKVGQVSSTDVQVTFNENVPLFEENVPTFDEFDYFDDKSSSAIKQIVSNCILSFVLIWI